MNEELKLLGEELSRQREAKGLTVTQVAQTTKISERFIEKMEQGEFNFLPLVNVKAFLRLVSSEIGLDPEVMVRGLMAQFQATPSPPTLEEEPRDEAPQLEERLAYQMPEAESGIPGQDTTPGKWDDATLWIKNPFVLGMVLVGVLVALYFLFYRTPAAPPSALESGISVPTTTLESLTDTTVTLEPIIEENQGDRVKAELLTLSLKASETAWVRIVYQDTLAEEGVFTTGIDRSWMSRENFYLKIGNAGGVRLLLNGRDLGTPGDVGQVVNIMIDKEGITPISLAEFPPAMGSSRP